MARARKRSASAHHRPGSQPSRNSHGLTIGTSVTAALGSRHGPLPLFELGSLVVDRVFSGEIWRVVTWSVLEPSPISLLFACLFLYWFGRDLAGVWGSRRFLNVYVG